MQPTDLTIEILKGIRDEVRTTNTNLEALRADTGARIEALRADTNARFDQLERRQVETEVRLSTELVRSSAPYGKSATSCVRIAFCKAVSMTTSAASPPSRHGSAKRQYRVAVNPPASVPLQI